MTTKTTAERLAHLQAIHKRAADVRRREDVLWARVEKARINLTEDAARDCGCEDIDDALAEDGDL